MKIALGYPVLRIAFPLSFLLVNRPSSRMLS